MLSYSVIVFDLDGTLMLTLDAKIENAVQAWHSTYTVLDRYVKELYLRHSGLPRRQLFQKIADVTLRRQIDEIEYRQLSGRFTKLNIETLAKTPLVPGARELLQDLSYRRIWLAISSSAEQMEVDVRFRKREESIFFEVILGSQEGFHKGKPHLESISDLTNIPMNKILFVGDEPNDLHLTREAGAKIALVAQTHPFEELALLKPDILVNTFSELRPHLLPN